MTLALALRHLQAGDLEQAERVCKKARKREPRDPQAMHLMGVIVHQRGRPAEALKLLEKAAQRQPDNPDCQYNLAECYRALGKANSAVAGYRRALAGAPDYAMAFVGIGETQLVQGQPSEAEGQFREALAKRVDLLPALDGLARALRAQGRVTDAVETWQRAISLDAKKPELYNNLGLALHSVGEMDDAVASLLRSLELEPSNAFIRRNFAECLKNRPVVTATPALRRQIEACFDAGDTDAQGLVAPTLSILEADDAIAATLALAATGRGTEILDASLDALWGDKLFMHLLRLTFIAKPIWERLLTRLRAIFMAEREAAPDEALFALATQCFSNEYVFMVSEAEQEAVDAVRRDLESGLADTIEPSRELERELGHVSMYVPLYALVGAERLLEPPPARWSVAFRQLLERQLREPLEELEIRKSIPTLSSKGHQAQAAVRAMYEENPYPRWFSVSARQPQPAEAVLSGLFPHFEVPMTRRRPFSVLIAGCGTGRQAIVAARRYKDSRVLANDLSLASLSYASRMARKLAVDNIDFRQGDLLDLTKLENTYHLIECTGVLQCFPTIADSLEAWRLLGGLLEPGGLMKIGLYSEIARAHVVAGREFIAQGGYAPTIEDIRRFRQDILALPDDRIERKLLKNRDFYSVSSCRDLVFHVQELRYTLPLIADMLNDLGMRFIGFELDKREALIAYRAAYPDDAEMSDLGNWHAFEQANPDTFMAMYQFWCQAT